jgi:hypothetical protein
MHGQITSNYKSYVNFLVDMLKKIEWNAEYKNSNVLKACRWQYCEILRPENFNRLLSCRVVNVMVLFDQRALGTRESRVPSARWHTLVQHPAEYINRYNIYNGRSVNIRVHVSYNQPAFIYKKLYGTSGSSIFKFSADYRMTCVCNP